MREFTLEHGGETLTLCLNAAAMCVAEDITKRPFGLLAPLLDGGSVTAIRAVLYAALQKHHPKLTISDVEQIIEADLGQASAKALEVFVNFSDISGTRLEELHKQHPFFRRSAPKAKKNRPASTS